jgi:hypothetical protein
MERRTFGYVTDTLIVYERVAGSVADAARPGNAR